MHAGGVFLTDIAALVIIDAVQFLGIGFQPQNLVLPQFRRAFEHPKRQPMRAERGGGVAIARRRQPARAKLGQARVARLVGGIDRPMHRQRLVARDHHLAPQPVKGQPLGQRIGLRRLAVDQYIAVVAPQDEVEQRLALRRQQRGPARFAVFQRQHVAGQQPLQEGTRLFAGNAQHRAVGKGGIGHRL